jgi:hypothetical protein
MGNAGVLVKLGAVEAGKMRLAKRERRRMRVARMISHHVRQSKRKLSISAARRKIGSVLETVNGLGGITSVKVSHRQVVVKRRIGGAELDRALEQRYRVIRPPGLEREHAQPMQGIRVLRILLQNRAIIAGGLTQTAGAMMLQGDSQCVRHAGNVKCQMSKVKWEEEKREVRKC